VSNVSESKKKYQSINVHFDVEEASNETIDDCANYPFCVELKRGNGELRIYMSKGEMECLQAQAVALLRESDQVDIEKHFGKGFGRGEL